MCFFLLINSYYKYYFSLEIFSSDLDKKLSSKLTSCGTLGNST